VKFLIDAQLPPALARAFEAAGCGARHVRGVGLLRASDADLWAFAHREG
jgi:predicted nuclease of predicted toxin-antitoxin system